MLEVADSMSSSAKGDRCVPQLLSASYLHRPDKYELHTDFFGFGASGQRKRGFHRVELGFEENF